MPELPEVETIRRDLEKRILNKEIGSVVVRYHGSARASRGNFSDTLVGETIGEIDRIGKLLIIKLTPSKQYMLVHLKMTGQLIYEEKDEQVNGGHSFSDIPKKLPGKHTHVIILFSDNSVLYFNDMRKFGYMQIVDEDRLGEVRKIYGIEPLTPAFTQDKFLNLFGKRKTNVKAFLLNQQLIAGLGNIYVDESCFRAGILPTRQVVDLEHNERVTLFHSIQEVIAEAIEKRGTSFRDYRDSSGKRGGFFASLSVYGRGGKMCNTCQIGTVEKVRLAGRGTHFCPHCQK